MSEAGVIEEHFNLRLFNALIRTHLHLNPSELDDDEWALRAGEAFLMMEIHAPNWRSKKEENE